MRHGYGKRKYLVHASGSPPGARGLALWNPNRFFASPSLLLGKIVKISRRSKKCLGSSIRVISRQCSSNSSIRRKYLYDKNFSSNVGIPNCNNKLNTPKIPMLQGLRRFPLQSTLPGFCSRGFFLAVYWPTVPPWRYVPMDSLGCAYPLG